MILYIAGPMTGLPDYNYPAFRTAQTHLVAAGYEVLCPVDSENLNPTPGTPQPWSWYMRHALRMVLDADGIALLPGWVRSRGARLEVMIGDSLGLRRQMVEAWIADAA